jgi:hypothetical protein
MAISAQGYHSWSTISYVLGIPSARPEVVIFLTVHANNVIHGDFNGVSSIFSFLFSRDPSSSLTCSSTVMALRVLLTSVFL